MNGPLKHEFLLLLAQTFPVSDPGVSVGDVAHLVVERVSELTLDR